jgi:acyl carrier protein
MNRIAAARMIHCVTAAAVNGGVYGKERMGQQTPAEHELAELVVSSLNLENIAATDIDPEAPLFGGELGLDSIDALELALVVSKRYGFALRSDNSDNKRIFGSLRALSAHIEQHRPH